MRNSPTLHLLVTSNLRRHGNCPIGRHEDRLVRLVKAVMGVLEAVTGAIVAKGVMEGMEVTVAM